MVVRGHLWRAKLTGSVAVSHLIPHTSHRTPHLTPHTASQAATLLTDLATHSERCFPDSAANIEASLDKLVHTANGGLDDECRKLTEDRSTWEPFASLVHTTFHNIPQHSTDSTDGDPIYKNSHFLVVNSHFG
jgi:hypothetical protein